MVGYRHIWFSGCLLLVAYRRARGRGTGTGQDRDMDRDRDRAHWAEFATSVSERCRFFPRSYPLLPNPFPSLNLGN